MRKALPITVCWLCSLMLALPWAAAASPTTQPGVSTQPARDMAGGYKPDRGPCKVALVDLTPYGNARDEDLPIRVSYPADPRGPIPVIGSHSARRHPSSIQSFPPGAEPGLGGAADRRDSVLRLRSATPEDRLSSLLLHPAGQMNFSGWTMLIFRIIFRPAC